MRKLTPKQVRIRSEIQQEKQELETELIRLKSVYSPGTLLLVSSPTGLTTLKEGRLEAHQNREPTSLLLSSEDIVNVGCHDLCFVVDYSLYEDPTSIDHKDNLWPTTTIRFKFFHKGTGMTCETYFTSKLAALRHDYQHPGDFESRFKTVEQQQQQ